MIWNPDLVNQTSAGVTIQNLKKEMVLIKVAYPEPSNELLDSKEYIATDGTTETALVSAGTSTSFSRSTPGTIPKGMGWSPTIGTYGVRISFGIVPNDGSPKTTIIKTVKAVKKNI